jgi:hypothetical protein
MQIKVLISFISRLSQRERIILYATMGVVSLVLLDRIILTPILDKINSLDQTIRAQEESIEQSLLIVTQEKRIEEETGQYASYLSKSETEEKVITAFLQEIETLAKKSSLYLVDIKSSGKNIDGTVIQYFVKLNFEAQMEQVIDFFYIVTNFEKLVKIEGYQLRPKSIGSSIVVGSITISKSIIYE